MKIDDVVGDRVGFVKIDVEGKEISVIKGMNKTIERYRPFILFEDHNGNTLRYIMDIYSFYNITEIAKANYLAADPGVPLYARK